jgi:signal transduction histidine kinase
MTASMDQVTKLPAASEQAPGFPMRLLGRLSARLLVLTILFVLLSEVLIYVPSIARFRETWLHDRLNAAIIASLALEAAGGRALPDDLRQEILSRAGVLAVSVKREERRDLVLAMAPGIMPAAFYDLDEAGQISLVMQAFAVLWAGDGRIVRVAGRPEMSPEEVIDIVIDETPLRHAMLAYSGRILALSIVISLITAGLVYLSLDLVFVRPMRRLTANMVSFRANPEDARRIIKPSGRSDEIGQAEVALASMQSELRAAFAQQSRLAALGVAVSKINHDLRNILATAQLFSDRFAESRDPLVQEALPKLVRAIDRAVELTTETLRYGRVTERPPRLSQVRLAPLIEEVAGALPAVRTGAIALNIAVEESLTAEADPDQLYRILLNLVRNAHQALTASGKGGAITVRAARAGAMLEIEVEDNGPGVPEAIRAHLFEAFSSSRGGGTGLGLAISRELARGHGGELWLKRTDASGTAFRLSLPLEPPPSAF